MTKIFGMEYSVACVPSFDSGGRPDLLAWDDAMDSHENEKEIWAEFHDEEAAKLCEPVLKRLFESREEDAKMQCDTPYFIDDDVSDNRPEPLSVEYFWEEVLWLDNGFDPDEFNWSDTDRDGNEYWWTCATNDYQNVEKPIKSRRKHLQEMKDGLTQQVPKEQDYLSVALNELESELRFAFNPYDMSASSAEHLVREKFEKIMRLGIQLYRDHGKYGTDWE